MSTIFEKDTVTIPQRRYEELIKTEEKYNIISRILYNNFKNILDDVWEQFKNIDFEKVKELEKEQIKKD